MKNQLIAFVIALSLGATLLAKDLALTACTSDKKEATLGVTFNDEVTAVVEGDVQKAFTDAAKGMTAEALLTREGFLAFVAGLSDEDRGYIVSITGAPEITGNSCK